MNNRDKLSELEKAIPFDEFFLNFRRAAYRVYCRNAKMKNQDKFKNHFKRRIYDTKQRKRSYVRGKQIKGAYGYPYIRYPAVS